MDIKKSTDETLDTRGSYCSSESLWTALSTFFSSPVITELPASSEFNEGIESLELLSTIKDCPNVALSKLPSALMYLISVTKDYFNSEHAEEPLQQETNTELLTALIASLTRCLQLFNLTYSPPNLLVNEALSIGSLASLNKASHSIPLNIQAEVALLSLKKLAIPKDPYLSNEERKKNLSV